MPYKRSIGSGGGTSLTKSGGAKQPSHRFVAARHERQRIPPAAGDQGQHTADGVALPFLGVQGDCTCNQLDSRGGQVIP